MKKQYHTMQVDNIYASTTVYDPIIINCITYLLCQFV